MKSKIISIMMIFMILMSNCSAVFAALQYDQTGGNAVSEIATVINDSVSLDSKYNAKSLRVQMDKIHFYKYGTTEEQTKLNGDYLASDYSMADYSKNNYYHIYNKKDEYNHKDGTSTNYDYVKFGFKIPAGNKSYSDVATVLYEDAIEYNEKKYNVKLNIKSIEKTGDDQVIFTVSKGARPQTTSTAIADLTNLDSYTSGVLPHIGARAESSNRDAQLEVDLEYIIEDKSGNPVAVSGVWGMEDIDNKEGWVLKNFQATRDNTYITSETANSTTDIEPLKYKSIDSVSGTYFYSSSNESTTKSNIYTLLDFNNETNTNKKVELTKTWNKDNGSSRLVFLDEEVISRTHNIITSVEGGTITPSKTNIRSTDDDVKIEYAPNEGYKLESITVDGEPVTIDDTNKTQYTFKKPITTDHTIHVKFVEDATIDYKVEHYKKNKEGQYELAETPETHSAREGTLVTATPKTTYTGYEENTTYEGRVPSGTVTAGTQLVLKLYYDPIIYKIEYELYGGKNDPSNPDKYTVEDNVVFQPATDKTGYDFKGWYEDPEFTKPITELPKGTTGNKKIYAKWEKSGDTEYTVEHYKKNVEGEYVLETTENLKGNIDEKVDAKAKTFEGYEENKTHKDRIPSGTIKADGSLKLKLYYDPIEYKINYVLDGGTNDSSNPDKYTINDSVNFKPATKPDNEFKGWYEDAEFKKPISGLPKGTTGDKTVYAKWEAKKPEEPKTAAYTVEHYKKNSDGEYEKAATDSLNGKVGDTAKATPKEFNGYKENTNYKDRVAEGTIKEDGSLKLKLYYDPIEYKINYVLAGGKNNPDNPDTYTPEDSVTFKEPTKTGYDFKGWYEDSEFKKPITELPIGSTGDKTIYAKWEASANTTYEVRHYKMDSDGDYELALTETLKGKTDETVTATPKEFKGYEENKDHEDRVASGKIKADGSLVLKLYYDPIEYKINYVTNGGTNDPRNPDEYTIDDPVTFSPATRPNHEFMGWYEDPEFTKPISSTTGKTGDLTVYAKWDEKTYTVSFDPQNGGTIPNQIVPYNGKATEPTKPTRNNYTFQYWYYKDANGKEVKYDFNTPVTSDVHLIAKWAPAKAVPVIFPKTGLMQILPVIAIMVFGMYAVVSGHKYRKVNKEIKRRS